MTVTSFVSVHGPPWLHLSPLPVQLLKFGLLMRIFLFTLMQIRIRMDPHYFGKLDPAWILITGKRGMRSRIRNKIQEL
jgi:hypothetical protein